MRNPACGNGRLTNAGYGVSLIQVAGGALTPPTWDEFPEFCSLGLSPRRNG